jgi:hypothetical protein
MTAITQQKANLKAIILRRIERKIDSGEVDAKDVAMAAMRRIASDSTLKELRRWNESLTIGEMMKEAEAGR